MAPRRVSGAHWTRAAGQAPKTEFAPRPVHVAFPGACSCTGAHLYFPSFLTALSRPRRPLAPLRCAVASHFSPNPFRGALAPAEAHFPSVRRPPTCHWRQAESFVFSVASSLAVCLPVVVDSGRSGQLFSCIPTEFAEFATSPPTQTPVGLPCRTLRVVELGIFFQDFRQGWSRISRVGVTGVAERHRICPTMLKTLCGVQSGDQCRIEKFCFLAGSSKATAPVQLLTSSS